ncbi:MAG: SPOR domain-containing protein [Candidatus Binatia bacterium]
MLRSHGTMPRRAGAARHVGTALAVAACCFAAPAAHAQVGSGAERYEVTITPPKRPGSEAAPAEVGDAPAAEGAAPTPAADGAAPPVAVAPASPAAGISLPPADAGAVTAKPAANLPMRTLQVGAFRHRGSAKELQGELAADFPDVTMIEVKSGGEPLYRVNVGRLPKGKALDELRGRLAAAGHASFDVEAPPASAAN